MEREQGRYDRYWADKTQEWNDQCIRCGACCGAFEDPCEHLRTLPSGLHSCSVYERRFGERRTVSGRRFVCVPIRDKLANGFGWPGDERCGYKKAGMV